MKQSRKTEFNIVSGSSKNKASVSRWGNTYNRTNQENRLVPNIDTRDDKQGRSQKSSFNFKIILNCKQTSSSVMMV